MSQRAVTTGRRILVAEDDDDMRELMTEVLRNDGAVVHGVADARSLHECLLSIGDSFDLIVSDLRMPRGNGLSVLEELRWAIPATPVILITAFCDDATRARGASLGATLLDKPFELGAFRALVASFTRSR